MSANVNMNNINTYNYNVTVGSSVAEDTDEKYFIHFESSKDLKKFFRENRFSIGHICCDGKGAHLIGVKSYQEVNKLKCKFYKSQQQINKSKQNTNSTNISFECPVCLDSKNTNKAYQMNCSHNICSTCINSIKNKNNLQNKCPICREPFT